MTRIEPAEATCRSEGASISLRRLAHVFVLLSLPVLFLPTAHAHPGGTADDGCHYCRSNCEKHDVEKDKRHCHGDKKAKQAKGGKKKQSGSSDVGEKAKLTEGQRVYVEKVTDGDTLKVRVLPGGKEKITIRILGIDCPESHANAKCRRDGKQGRMSCAEQVPIGKKAAKHAAKLLKRKVVTLHTGTDDGAFKIGGYGRVLAYVHLEDGTDYGLHMVKKRMCQDFHWKYPHPRGGSYPEWTLNQ